MVNAMAKALGLAGTWAVIWALPAFPIEGLSNLGIDFSFTNAVDIWPAVLGLPGLTAGVAFAALLAVQGRLGGFETLPAGGLAARGALAGLVVFGIVILMLGVPRPGGLLALLVGIAVVLGAIAGPVSAWAFRWIGRHRAPDAARA